MDKKIKIIFAGTADIATPLLRAFSGDSRFKVASVITQADKPSGRNLELKPSPVKTVAQELSLPIIQPDSINSIPDEIKKQKPDAIIVMAYGQILKKDILNIPPEGCFNVHASVLPKYRGASPIQSALLNNEKETGISLMQMAEGMDSGPIYADFKIKIDKSDNAMTLADKLADLTAKNIPDAVYLAIKGENKPKDQDEKTATYCIKIRKEDGNINWNEDAEIIMAKIRAFAGWPGTYTFFKGKRLKIIKAESGGIDHKITPGTVFKSDERTAIATSNGAIIPVKLQPEGKTAQNINDFINGNPDFINSKLTPTP